MDVVYFYIVPLLVFGPLFLYIFYNFGLRELAKMPAEIRARRKREAEEAEAFRIERERKRGKGPISPTRRINTTPLGIFLQIVTYAWFAAIIGLLASFPPYAYTAQDEAQIKLSLSHAGKRKVECQRRTREELMKLPPNMRAPKDCPRERWPIQVELLLDDTVIFSDSSPPTGLSDDGPSLFYETFIIPAGDHKVEMRMREDGGEAFNFTKTVDINVKPSQVVIASFDDQTGIILE